MSEKSLISHVCDSPVYTIDNDKRKFIVTSVYKIDGENICDILLKLIGMDEDESHKQT